MRRLLVMLAFLLIAALGGRDLLEWALVALEAPHFAHLPFVAIALVAFVSAPIRVHRGQPSTGPVQARHGLSIRVERVRYSESRAIAAVALVTCIAFAGVMTWLASDAWRMSRNEPVLAKVISVDTGHGANSVEVLWRDTSDGVATARFSSLTDDIPSPAVGTKLQVRISARDPALATPASVSNLTTFTVVSISLWVVAALLAMQLLRIAVVIGRNGPGS